MQSNKDYKLALDVRQPMNVRKKYKAVYSYYVVQVTEETKNNGPQQNSNIQEDQIGSGQKR